MSERGTVILKHDGTLVDSAPDLADALDEFFRERERAPIALKCTRKLIGHGINIILDQFADLTAAAECLAKISFSHKLEKAS